MFQIVFSSPQLPRFSDESLSSPTVVVVLPLRYNPPFFQKTRDENPPVGRTRYNGECAVRPSEDTMMAANSIVVQKPPSTFLCSFSLYASTVIMAFLQSFLTGLLAILYRVKIEGDSVIVKILFWIHVTCSICALLFSLFCLAKRKIGSTYEVVLHGYLLSVLINGLTALFGVLYVPLFFLQTEHSLMEGLDYFICFSLAGVVLFLQWAVKQVTEQMLPVMEHDFKV